MNRKFTAKSLGIFLMFAYLVSYVTRINFGAVIIEMVTDLGTSKTALSVAVTGSFITYGIGQIVSGWLGDKVQPKALVLTGLLSTTLMNLLIPFCPNPFFMTVVWCVNGFAQALMWPPIVKIMANFLSGEDYDKASSIVIYGGTFGTILVYLVCPIIISLSSWHMVFVFSAVCGIIMSIIWKKLCPIVNLNKKVEQKEKANIFKIILSPLLIFIMLCIVFQGALRDGITTWMPSYMAETYDLGNTIAILTSVVLPVFTLIFVKLANYIYEKIFRNLLLSAGVFFGAGSVCAILLFMFSNSSPIVSIALSALLTGTMNGVNFLLICIMPKYFKFTGCVSLISGILNFCTYIGSAISTFGIAFLTENLGWKPTIFIWFAVVFMGTVFCLVFTPRWKKFVKHYS
ncbi:MAG: MFS transporter [Ruminococcaceae bacterium]|nr:MFS transporter [Oscillospiraceae bacterium]